MRNPTRCPVWWDWAIKPQSQLRLQLALDLIQEHPLPVFDLPRLVFLLRIRRISLAAPRRTLPRLVLLQPRHVLLI